MTMRGVTLTRDGDFDHIPAHITDVRLWDCGVTWRDIHKGPGQFDWTRLDTLVSKCEGKRITYVIAATPRWLAKHPDNPHEAPWLGKGSNSVPSDLGQWATFTRMLASRYRGKIHAYEIWNEPQLADFLYPYTDVRVLGRMTAMAMASIKTADPDVLLLAASVLPRPKSGGMRKASKYLRVLKANNWPVDGYTCHIYPEIGKGTRRWKWMLRQVQATLALLRAPHRKRLWVTETSYNLLGPGIRGIEARRLVAATHGSFKGPIFWYAPGRGDLGGLNTDSDSYMLAEGRS